MSKDMKKWIIDQLVDEAATENTADFLEFLEELVEEGFPQKEAYLLQVKAHMLAKLAACFEFAAEMNERNEQGGIKFDEFNWDDFYEEVDIYDFEVGGPVATDEPPGPISCTDPEADPSPTGTTFGDVHVATFDGLGYDNHAVGEFLVFDNGGIVVQMRLEPVENSQGASIVTAVAIQVDGHSVSLHPIGRTWIDGNEVSLERGIPYPLGSAEILRSSSRWVVATADGTVIHASDNIAGTTDSLVLMIRPSAVPSIGMFGSPDGDPDNDLVTRGGSQIEPHVRFDFETFHTNYIDSWRIAQDESLFHYESGETTDSFLIEGWPHTWMTVAGLEPLQRSEAEQICRDTGVTREDLLLACIFDVGVTGEPGYAYQTFVVQANTPDLTLPSTPVENDPDASGVFAIGNLSFDLGPADDALDGSARPSTGSFGCWPRSTAVNRMICSS